MTYQPLDHHLLKLAVAQSGAFSSAQAVAAGCSYAHLRHRERTGRIHRVRRGLYLHAGFPRSWLQDLWLEQLAAGDRSAVCGEAAAQLHGFNRFTRQTVEVERVQGGNHEAARGSVHETFWLPPHHVTNVEGLPVTTVARTVFDLAGLPRHPAAFRNEGLREIHTKRITWLVNHAIRDHGMRMIDLNRVLAAVGRRGKPGTAIIRAVVADLGVDYEPADSELEDLFLEVCAAFGIEAPDGQINLGTKDRWVGRVDFVWRRAKLIAEIDGSQHRAPLDRRSDRRRDCDLGGEGWTVIRITWWQLVHEPESVVARLRAHLSFSRWQRAHSAR
jgi:hypothetical protein